MSFGYGNKTTKQSSQSTTQPWEATIPYLTSLLGSTANAAGSPAPTANQIGAISNLEANAGQPFAPQIQQTANDAFNATSRAPQVEAGNTDFNGQLGRYANGDMLDFDNNPYIQHMLSQVGNDVQWRTNRMFAGAGRDLSGINQEAVSRGVANAQTPILANLFSEGQRNQIDAAGRLHDANTNDAVAEQALDTGALNTRVNLGNTAATNYTTARDARDTSTLQLEEMLRGMPFEQLSRYASLLLPIAGLGSQTQGTGTSNTSGFNFGLSLNPGAIPGLKIG